MATAAVLTLAALLRVVLALVNTEANDDHLAVITMIARQHRLPRAHELFEAYQPKLYHVTAAELWRIGPWRSESSLLRTAQLLSCGAGILALLLVHSFLRRQAVGEGPRLIALSLVALNPKLIGLNAQATNDSFVILFGTLSLYLAWSFLTAPSVTKLLLTGASCILAALSKGSGLVVFVTILLVLGVAVLRAPWPHGERRRVGAYVALFLVAVVPLFCVVGPYHDNYEESGGNPFAINVAPDPLPPLVHDSYVRRPGTTSIVHTYLTFRLADLLRHPTEPQKGNGPYPLHRTSLWSQLYGRLSSLHFDQWPPSWQDVRPITLTVVRASMLLGIFPSILLLTGAVRAAKWAVPLVSRRAATAEGLAALLFLTSIAAFTAFIIVFTLRYRDFASMKVEYMLPCLLAVTAFVAWGSDWVWMRCSVIIACLTCALVAVHLLDVVLLVQRLA